MHLRGNRGKWILISGLLVAIAAGFAMWFYKPDRVIASVQMEAGTELVPAEAFLLDKGAEAEYGETVLTINTSLPGEYPITIQSGRFIYEAVLRVVDSVPPVGQAQALTIWMGEACKPEDFILYVEDRTKVTVTFGESPDYSGPGTQEIELVLTDEGGNQTLLTAELTILQDLEPPVIKGVQDQEINVGDAIAYKKGITVTDNHDSEVTLEVDSSQVDRNTPGTYTVFYQAVDSAGNQAEETAVITVRELDEGEEYREEMEKLAREVLQECISDHMTDRDKLYGIFWYIKYNMSYTGDSDKTSQINAAIRGLKWGSGDCFTYFAMAKVLMEEAGFETIDVERINGETKHYWSLVKVDGEWYHYDTCPRSVAHNKYWYCFLRTDAELKAFSEKYDGYYTFDTSLYPATP